MFTFRQEYLVFDFGNIVSGHHKRSLITHYHAFLAERVGNMRLFYPRGMPAAIATEHGFSIYQSLLSERISNMRRVYRPGVPMAIATEHRFFTY